MPKEFEFSKTWEAKEAVSGNKWHLQNVSSHCKKSKQIRKYSYLFRYHSGNNIALIKVMLNRPDRDSERSIDELEQQEFEREIAQSQSEWWREEATVLRLGQQLSAERQHALEQELRAMNDELFQRVTAQQPMGLNAAKEVAKQLLTEEKPTRETLAKMLSLIYGETILPQALICKERRG